jgi:hypothetical protein
MAKVQSIVETQARKFVFNLERVPQKSGGVRYGHPTFGSIYVPQDIARTADSFAAHVTIHIEQGAH